MDRLMQQMQKGQGEIPPETMDKLKEMQEMLKKQFQQ